MADDEFSLQWAGRDVLVTRVKGTGTDALADAHIAESLRAYRMGIIVHHFFDLEEMTSYTSASRTRLTEFALANRASIGSATGVVRSKIAAMGVQTASLALGLAGFELVLAKDRVDFQARIRRCLASPRKKLGSSP